MVRRRIPHSVLVREDGDQLHLLSVVSPEWIGKGKTIAVAQAPTWFGTVAFTLDQPREDEAILNLNTDFTAAPKEVVVHLPWFVDLKSATVDGKTAHSAHGFLSVSADAKELRMPWSVKPNAPHMSYESAVND
jgi:hypothetical protein